MPPSGGERVAGRCGDRGEAPGRWPSGRSGGGVRLVRVCDGVDLL